jgi:bifunctional non-homologous end joining protein LigD
MALEKYKAKRDFTETPEPNATATLSRRAKKRHAPLFVVQEHHASRLHYDFRLEVDGALASWAVPKEPSMDPGQNRLAVRVEDHPLGYANFEGTIPEGQYGAGTVSIWDRGTYENLLEPKAVPQSMREGIEKGHLEFVLHGKRLKGRFALIRMGGRQRGKENWLLIKMKDEFARPAASREDGAKHEARSTSRAKRPSPSSSARRTTATSAEKVRFTHLDKAMYPEAGITKGDVIEFYRRIAPRLLPHLRDRPVTLERFPEGIGAQHFWQKNTPTYYPSWIPRIELPAGDSKRVQYVLVNDLATLLYLVNQDALTFHVGFSRVEDHLVR